MTEKYNIVFVWNEDKKPSDTKIALAVHVQHSTRFCHVSTLDEAQKMLHFLQNTTEEILHTTSVPQNAFNFLGGKRI